MKDVSCFFLVVQELQSSFPQKFRILFDSIDPEGFGEIAVDDFLEALQLPEIQAQVPINKREILYERAMKAKKHPGTVSFDDFVNVVSKFFFYLCVKKSYLNKLPKVIRITTQFPTLYFNVWSCDRRFFVYDTFLFLVVINQFMFLHIHSNNRNESMHKLHPKQ